MTRLLLNALLLATACGDAPSNTVDEAPPEEPTPTQAAEPAIEAPEPMRIPEYSGPGEGYGIPADGTCVICFRGRTGKELTVPEAFSPAFDGDLDTAWCGPVTDATFDIALDEPRVLGEVELVGGHFASAEEMAKHGRVKTLTVTPKGEEPLELTVQDPTEVDFEQAKRWHPIFEAKQPTVSSVNVKVAAVYPEGAEDVCIAELILTVGDNELDLE